MEISGRTAKFFKAWQSIFIGLGITIRRVRMPEATLKYPFEKPQIADRFRGAPMVVRYQGESDEKEGSCIACGLCAKTCPVKCITVERNKDKESPLKVADWTLDITKCMMCGLCTEVCPTDALRMSHDYENSEYRKEKLVYDQQRVLRRPMIIPPRRVTEEL